MNRRKFLGSAAGLVLGSGCGLLPGQPQPRVARIGMLESFPVDPPELVRAFVDQLAQSGWVEGQNITIERRSADGHFDRLAGLAAELVSLRVELIVAVAGQAISAAMKTTTTVPIVMTSTSDPVASGFVVSLARPGGNVTGNGGLAPETGSKAIQLLWEVIPSLKRAAAIVDTSGPGAWRADLAAIQAAADALGIELDTLSAVTSDEVDGAIEAARRRDDGLFLLPGNLFESQRARIVQLVAQARLPTMYTQRQYVTKGGLMAFGPVQIETWRRVADYVDKILRGASPANLPVQRDSIFAFIVNQTTLGSLGLTLPESISAQVTEWIP